MDEIQFPQIIHRLYAIVEELEEMFPGRHFTPDGHMVGSIGEALAAYYYGLELLPASSKGRDATCGEKIVEIKATQGSTVGLRCVPEHLLVLKLARDGSFSEIYNGDGERVWKMLSHKPVPSNGQYKVGLSTLKRLMKDVPERDRLARIRPRQ